VSIAATVYNEEAGCFVHIA